MGLGEGFFPACVPAVRLLGVLFLHQSSYALQHSGTWAWIEENVVRDRREIFDIHAAGSHSPDGANGAAVSLGKCWSGDTHSPPLACQPGNGDTVWMKGLHGANRLAISTQRARA